MVGCSSWARVIAKRGGREKYERHQQEGDVGWLVPVEI